MITIYWSNQCLMECVQDYCVQTCLFFNVWWQRNVLLLNRSTPTVITLLYPRWFVGRFQAEKRPQSHTRRTPTQRWELDGGTGLMVGLVNAPLGFPQAETSTNISIITQKPHDCQAQSPDVADNMFELLVVKVRSCSSNMDEKPRCHFQSHSQPQIAVFSWQECASFPLHSHDNIRRPEECESCFSLNLPSSVWICFFFSSAMISRHLAGFVLAPNRLCVCMHAWHMIIMSVLNACGHIQSPLCLAGVREPT